MTAYYNEMDPFAAQWLRNLIAAGHIAPGDVDERDIWDVPPDDLRSYAQCHFFAGIGGWSYALRLAGWGDERPVWTGSCPCQPFSQAGQGKGFADERHLWPAWFWLIQKCRPPVIFGEQVEAAIQHGWLDLVSSDLEGEGYAVGAAILPAACVEAPHGRHRLWFMADATSRDSKTKWIQRSREYGFGSQDGCLDWWENSQNGNLEVCKLGLANGSRPQSGDEATEATRHRDSALPASQWSDLGMGDPDSQRRTVGAGIIGDDGTPTEQTPGEAAQQTSPWSDLEWLYCRDGNWRPTRSIKSHVLLLANGISDRMGYVCAEIGEAAQKEITTYAEKSEARPGEALLDLWQAAYSEAIQWASGGYGGVSAAQVLLAFLCQLKKQGWSFAKSIPLSSAEVQEIGVRGLRGYSLSPCPSCGRKLDEQCVGKPANALHILSSFLARCSCQAWGEDAISYARHAFPLDSYQVNRVGRLRAYGNAIIPQVAAVLIREWLICSQSENAR